MSNVNGCARKIAATQAGATPKYTRHSDDVSPWRIACNVETERPMTIKTGEITSRVLNSSFAEFTTVAGSLAEVSACPTEVRNHSTLLSNHVVTASNRSPNVALAIEVVMQAPGVNKQSTLLIN
jgi:hypothetical protein